MLLLLILREFNLTEKLERPGIVAEVIVYMNFFFIGVNAVYVVDDSFTDPIRLVRKHRKFVDFLIVNPHRCLIIWANLFRIKNEDIARITSKNKHLISIVVLEANGRLQSDEIWIGNL